VAPDDNKNDFGQFDISTRILLLVSHSDSCGCGDTRIDNAILEQKSGRQKFLFFHFDILSSWTFSMGSNSNFLLRRLADILSTYRDGTFNPSGDNSTFLKSPRQKDKREFAKPHRPLTANCRHRDRDSFS
jgi:hypothetical protein